MKENMQNSIGKEKTLISNEGNEDVLGALNNQNFEMKKPQPTKTLFMGAGNAKKEKDVKKWLKRI